MSQQYTGLVSMWFERRQQIEDADTTKYDLLCLRNALQQLARRVRKQSACGDWR
jgi:hypothetical protein